MKRFFWLLWLVLSFGLTACIDLYEPGIEEGKLRLVVDGLITDQPGPYTVALYLSSPYNNSNVSPPEAGARLNISDDEGRGYELKEIRRGVYQTDSAAFRGEAGRAYTLRIQLSDGREFQSHPELLQSSPPIDSIFGIYQERRDANGLLTRSFDIYSETTDDRNTRAYYRWDWQHYEVETYCLLRSFTPPGGGSRIFQRFGCCGPCWKIDRCPGCINIASDAVVNGNRFRRRHTSAIYDSKDPYFVVIDQYVLSEASYRFWQAVDGQINRTGGIFDKPPATVVGNLFSLVDSTEQVLGVFTAAGLSRRGVYVPRNYVEVAPQIIGNAGAAWQNQPGCMPCTANNRRTPIQPSGW